MFKPKQVKIAEAYTKYIPYNFAFVLSSDVKGKPSGMIAAWHTKLSHEPPLMGVCLFNSQNTRRLISESKEFILAIPDKKLLPAIKIFGEFHGDKINKFEVSKVKTFKIEDFKTPLLADATINFACKLVKTVPMGDHMFFVGQVKKAYVNDGQKILLSYGKKNGKRVFKEC